MLFCHNCGQRTKVGRLTIKEILSDFFSSVFNLDAPFPRTLFKLFTQPQYIIKEYLFGKRKTYYAPVKYMVLCLFLNLLIGELIGFDPIENQKAMDPRTVDQQSMIGYKAGAFLSQYLNFFLFLQPFAVAIVSKLFFWKSDYNFAERTALGFYVAGQFIVISLLPIFLSKVNPGLFHIMYPLAIFYFTFAFYRFFESRNKFFKVIKSFLTALFSFISYIIVSYTIAYFIVINQ